MISKVEAYSCQECFALFLNKEEANKCVQKHFKLAEKKRKAAEAEAEAIAKRNWIRFNLKSFREFPNLFREFAKNYGYDANFEISGKIGTRRICWDEPVSPIPPDTDVSKMPCFIGRIQGEFYLLESNKAKDNPFEYKKECIGDFIRNNVIGVRTGCGNGGKRFSYEISMFVQDFPLINEVYQEFLLLEDEPKLYLTKIKVAEQEYKEYFEMRKLADVAYQVLLMEQTEAKEKLRHIEEAMKLRSYELDDERESRLTISKSEGLLRYEKLKECFSI